MPPRFRGARRALVRGILSPRRGGAKNAFDQTKPLSAPVALADVPEDLTLTNAMVALPLPGERAGVRADQQVVHRLHFLASCFGAVIIGQSSVRKGDAGSTDSPNPGEQTKFTTGQSAQP